MIYPQNTITKPIISPVSRTAGHTQVGFIDCLGANYATIDVNTSDIATVGTASATGGSISVGHAADTNVSNAVTVVANQTGLKVGRLTRYLIDTKSKERYLHVTFTAGTAGVSNETQLVSVTGSVSRLEQSPTAAGGMVTGLTNSNAIIVA